MSAWNETDLDRIRELLPDVDIDALHDRLGGVPDVTPRDVVADEPVVELDSSAHRKDLDVAGLEELTGGKLVELEQGYEVRWPDGDFVQIHRDGDRLHFDYLFSQSGKHRLAQLVSSLPAFFRVQGIRAFVTTRSAATDAMLKVGFELEGGYLVCPIDEGGRMDVYTARRAAK